MSRLYDATRGDVDVVVGKGDCEIQASEFNVE
jgi:hypothetical protein